MLQPVKGGFTQRDIDAANLSHEKQVLLSFLLMNDMNLEGLVKAKAEQENALSLRKRLRKEQETTSKGKKAPAKKKAANPSKFNVEALGFEFGSDGIPEESAQS